MKKFVKLALVITAIVGCTHTIEAQIREPLPVAKATDVDLSIYTGIISEQYADGSPSLRKELENGKATGLWLEWFPNGTLRYRAHWENNLGNGKWEYFYPNGRLRSESFYINDIAQGIYRSYYENGQLKNDMVFLNGAKDGVEFSYDVDGSLLARKFFKNGIQVIDEPIIFQEGLISAADGNEWGISFMPDGNTAYFTRRDINTGKKRIYVTEKSKNAWSKPTVAPFSTDEDEGAFINKEGNKLYFASYRPLPDGSTSQKMDMNIWVMDRVAGQWSNPKPLSSVINKSMASGNEWPAKYEAGPTTDQAGNLYYWTKGSKNNATNLFKSTLKTDGTYGPPVELISPSSPTNYDTAPQFSPDGNIMFFSSDDRIDGYGGGDIYYSKRVGDKWSTPKNLGPIVNSSSSEGSPSFSPDGKYFYFSSNKSDKTDSYGDKIWDLYHLETKFLDIY